MPASVDPPRRDLWKGLRLPVLVLLLVILIVVVPFLFLRWVTYESLEASAWVTHTQQVQAVSQHVVADVRDVEAATLALALGLNSASLRQRIAAAESSLASNLERLSRLVRDNPEQQEQIARLQTMVTRRLELARAVAGHRNEPEQARMLAEDMTVRYPLRTLADTLLEREDRLLAERSQRAARLRWWANVLGWVAIAVQLVLLFVLLRQLQRQVGQRLHMERSLLRASARATAVLQTVREPIVLLDGQRRLLMYNPAFAELYGLPDDAPGLVLDEVGHGAFADPVIRQRLADVLLRGRELWDYEHEQKGVDGLGRTMLLNARRMPLPDSDDHVVLMTVSDVTVQKTAQHQIERLNRQLEGKVEQVSEVNRELEAFSYSVSHDLRAPLRHIAGFVDKLGRHLGESADEKSLHYMDVIATSAQRMAALIDDLLVYSRLGRSALRLQAVDMQSMVAETRAMLDAQIEEAGDPHHRVEWQIAPLPVVIADENMMRQVWQNLLGNAVKYSGKREVAKIRVDYRQQPDGSHLFTVSDNGAGFDMAYAGKLFGVFQRLHKASEYSGTGIGLASVRRVLSRHGGRIWAEAEPDKGARFHFTLPPALDAPQREQTNA